MTVDRRLRIAAIVTLVVVLLAGAAAAVVLLVAPRGGSAPTPSGTPPGATTSASPDASASPPTVPSPSPDSQFGEPVADEVPKDGEAVFNEGVVARIDRLTSITATGTVAGEVSGPAVQVDLVLENRTGATVPLDGVTVNAYYGEDKRPASPIGQTASPPFSGSVAAGAVAHGQYVFTVPREFHDSIVITVSIAPGSAVVVFE